MKLVLQLHFPWINVIFDSIPYSIACDGSNRGNKKMFPCVIKYFTLEKGI